MAWYQDWFSSTWETCGSPDAFVPYTPLYPWENDDVEIEQMIDDTCLEAVWTDMKVDTAYIEANSSNWPEFAGRLAMYGYYILASPVGTVDELRERTEAGEQYLGEPFVEELEILAELTGVVEVRPLVYNLAMSAILRTVWIDDWEAEGSRAWADIKAREVHLGDYSNEGFPYGSALFVHEAAHLWLQRSHVVCLEGAPATGTRSCDDDWTGAFGYDQSYATAVVPHLEWETAPDTAQVHLESLEERLDYVEYIHTECCADELGYTE